MCHSILRRTRTHVKHFERKEFRPIRPLIFIRLCGRCLTFSVQRFRGTGGSLCRGAHSHWKRMSSDGETEESHSSRASYSSHASIGLSSHASTGYGSAGPVPPSPGTTRRMDEEKRMSLEERHQQMNTLFGIKPFKSHISRRRVGERSPAVRGLYDSTRTFTSIPGKLKKKIVN